MGTKTTDVETLVEQRIEQLVKLLSKSLDGEVQSAIGELDLIEGRMARCREKISACKERHAAERKKLDQTRLLNVSEIIDNDSEQMFVDAVSKEGEIASRASGYERIVEDLEDTLLRLEKDRDEARRKISLLVTPKVTAIKAEIKNSLDRILEESVWVELRAWDRACWAIDKASKTSGDVANHCALMMLTPTKVREHIPPY
ncbi:MAG TPA: hypothetical protein PLO63_11695 [Syntrophales bacterium]|nr:hypothetical protein [Syntrophales bacterium]